ncbi:PEP-CTERM sorting domain-containing protein [Nitrosomonas oligotropha]|uniref:PEP-CTERM sorting domain-containing protein n=1 Tax=Nitrosomonas oligotropha TaxID=42354 RepID=UPI001F03F01B|nr:PEP-CTERM sorting domain-containing protein [Nitrosomonas oligotropha]
MNKKILLSAAILAAVSTTNANADLITFDDIKVDSFGSVGIPSGYHGFDWHNFYVNNGKSSYPGTGYEHGTVSPSNAAFNGDGDPASISSRFYYFDLESVYITKAWHNGWTHFEGFIGDTLTYSKDVFSDTITPDLLTFNWAGMTKLTMSDGNLSGQTVLDNMAFTFGEPIPIPDPIPDPIPLPVPEPSTYAMLLAGLGLLGLMVCHRKESAV